MTIRYAQAQRIMHHVPVTIPMIERAKAVIAQARLGAQPERQRALEAAKIIRDAQLQRNHDGLSGIDLEPARRVVITLVAGSRVTIHECIEAVRCLEREARRLYEALLSPSERAEELVHA